MRGGFQNAAKRTAPNPCYNRTNAYSRPTNADDQRTEHRHRHSSRRSNRPATHPAAERLHDPTDPAARPRLADHRRGDPRRNRDASADVRNVCRDCQRR